MQRSRAVTSNCFVTRQTMRSAGSPSDHDGLTRAKMAGRSGNRFYLHRNGAETGKRYSHRMQTAAGLMIALAFASADADDQDRVRASSPADSSCGERWHRSRA